MQEAYDDHARSFKARESGKMCAVEGNPPSICDALQAPLPGKNTWPINKRLLTVQALKHTILKPLSPHFLFYGSRRSFGSHVRRCVINNVVQTDDVVLNNGEQDVLTVSDDEVRGHRSSFIVHHSSFLHAQPSFIVPACRILMNLFDACGCV